MTIANLALLPNWSSLDSVRRAHSDLELAAIVFFALLVVMEALAHNSADEKRKHLFDTIGIWFFAIAVICELFAYRYGQRNDFLSASVISSLDTKAGDALRKASQAHDLAQSASDIALPAKEKAEKAKGIADAASARAAEVDRSLWMTQYLLSGRQIPDTAFLKTEFEKLPHPLSVFFRSYPSDIEAYIFCDELVSVARAAGITATDQCGAWFVLNGQTVTSVAVSGPDDATMLALEQVISDARPIGGVRAGPFGNAPHSPVYVVFVGVKMPFEPGQARPTPLPKKSIPAKK